MNLFEEIVLFLGRKRSAGQLEEHLGIGSGEAARVGVVLSASAAIADVSLLVQAPSQARWLAGRLDTIGRSSAADLRALAIEFDLTRLGLEVLGRGNSPAIDQIIGGVAERAELSDDAAETLVVTTAATMLVRLAARHPHGADATAVAADLSTEYQALLVEGWEPWFESVLGATPSNLDSSPPEQKQAQALVDPPLAEPDQPAEPDRPDQPLSGQSSSASSTSSPTLRAAPSAGAAPATAVARSGETARSATAIDDEKRQSRRRIVALLAAFAIGIVLVAVFFTRPDGDQAQIADSPTSTDGDEANNTTEQNGQDSISNAESPDGQAAVEQEDPAASSASDTNTDPVIIEVPMDDPLGLTDGVGMATLTLDPSGGEVCYDFGVDGVGNPYDGHIHVGPAGVKGGIVVDFGELNGSPSGCFANNPADIQAIVADLSGHYVEFHDPDDVTTIRAQLADPPEGSTAAVSEDVAGGAVIVIEAGALILRGDVPDQVTIDKLLETFADIDLGPTLLVNELVVVPGSPRPSGNIVVDDAILFDVGSDQLNDPDSTVLADLATIFKARPAWAMTIVGHTDSTGSEVFNLELSLQRANAVRAVLSEAGVSDEALTVRGAGSTDPVADNDTAEGRTANRRIEVVITPG